jgi:hypothetical protein
MTSIYLLCSLRGAVLMARQCAVVTRRSPPSAHARIANVTLRQGKSPSIESVESESTWLSIPFGFDRTTFRTSTGQLAINRQKPHGAESTSSPSESGQSTGSQALPCPAELPSFCCAPGITSPEFQTPKLDKTHNTHVCCSQPITHPTPSTTTTTTHSRWQKIPKAQ